MEKEIFKSEGDFLSRICELKGLRVVESLKFTWEDTPPKVCIVHGREEPLPRYLSNDFLSMEIFEELGRQVLTSLVASPGFGYYCVLEGELPELRGSFSSRSLAVAAAYYTFKTRNLPILLFAQVA